MNGSSGTLAHVAHAGPARKGNPDAALTRLSNKYFGKSVGANVLRYLLTGLFSSHDLGGLHLFLGHQPDHSANKLMRIEHEHYLRKDDHERVKMAKRHYEVVRELLKEPERLMAVARKVL